MYCVPTYNITCQNIDGKYKMKVQDTVGRENNKIILTYTKKYYIMFIIIDLSTSKLSFIIVEL